MAVTSRLLALAIVLTGCGSPGLEDGTLVPSCVECGPGALVEGRYYGGTGRFAANTNGQAVRALGADGQAHLFDSELRMGKRLPDAGFVSFTDWPIRMDLAGNVVALNDVGVVFIDSSTAHIRWQQPLSNMRFVEVSEAFVFVVTGPDWLQPTLPSQLHALRINTGEIAWKRTLPKLTTAAIASDGRVIVGGTFTGALDLGGDTTAQSSATAAGWVAVLDEDGVARTSVVVGQGAEAAVSITDVAVGANGTIGFVGSWTGGSMSIGTVMLPAAPTDRRAEFVGMLGSDGTLQWARTIGTEDRLELAQSLIGAGEFEVVSVLTDGADLFISGSYWAGGQSGFAARVTRDTTAWAALVNADSDVDHLRLLALVEPDEIIAAVVWNKDRCASDCGGSWFRYGNHETEVIELEAGQPGSVLARLRR